MREASKKKMAEFTKLFNSCSLLMAALFAYSASVQFNGSDWYFWFPLYASATVVNMFHRTLQIKAIRLVAKVAFWLGISLFLTVVIEDYINGLAGFWSLDLSKRVAREKMGSAFAETSMLLQLEASKVPKHRHSKKTEVARSVQYGMALLVGWSYGLSLVFVVLLKGDASR